MIIVKYFYNKTKRKNKKINTHISERKLRNAFVFFSKQLKIIYVTIRRVYFNVFEEQSPKCY